MQRALAIDLDLGENAAAAADTASLGSALRKLGRLDKAVTALTGAFDLIGPADEPFKLCMLHTVISLMLPFCLLGIVNLELAQGRTEQALAAYRQSVDGCRRARYVEGLAQLLREPLRAAGELNGNDRAGSWLGATTLTCRRAPRAVLRRRRCLLVQRTRPSMGHRSHLGLTWITRATKNRARCCV